MAMLNYVISAKILIFFRSILLYFITDVVMNEAIEVSNYSILLHTSIDKISFKLKELSKALLISFDDISNPE